MKQLSARLRLNYSSTREVSQLKSLTLSPLPLLPCRFIQTQNAHAQTKATAPFLSLALNRTVPSGNTVLVGWMQDKYTPIKV